MSGVAVDPKTFETASSKLTEDAKGAMQALFPLFLSILWSPACVTHKISLPCVSPYNLMEDCVFLSMGTPELYKAVLHKVRVVPLFAKAHQCRNVLLVTSNLEISLGTNKREDPV